jgi:NAD(P)-dependent dehydrogenase (short-subunit alcohol dehydrogenase family)
MTDRYLTDRVAMVTGGASGMGRAIALALAEKGADVIIGSLLAKGAAEATDGVVVHRPGEAEMQQTRQKIEEFGVRAYACGLDVCQPTVCDDFYDRAIQAFGRVDILANAAGITAEQTISGHSEALWLKVMDVNANGPFRMTRLVLPAMIEQGWGRIINIASTAASVGGVTSGAYCASKAAVVGLTRCVAQEGAPHGVTCNAISPGWVATDFQQKWMARIAAEGGRQNSDDITAGAIADNPQKRLIKPREIAALAAFLCSRDAFGITGQDLTVSGGSLW